MKNLLVRTYTMDSVRAMQGRVYDGKTRYASLSWGMFDEAHDIKPTELYNHTVFNTTTKKIDGFTKPDNIYNSYNFDPVVFALNVDPLTSKFPGMSPYSAFANSPISHVDVDGNYALFIHYMLTKYTLKQVGVPEVQARLIAHYASVYADNPGGVSSSSDSRATSVKTMLIFMSNVIGGTSDNPIFADMGGTKMGSEEAMNELHYLPGIDYSRTTNSQGENDDAQKWHATRFSFEKGQGVTATDAANRSIAFAWESLFKSANGGGFEKMTENSESIQDFAQGLHSFQDLDAHAGAVFKATLKNGKGYFSTDGNEHNLGNDTHPNQNKFIEARYMTLNAVKVFQILTGNINKLSGDNGDISTRGMSKAQVNTLMDKIKSGGYITTSTSKNSFTFHK